MPPHLREFVVQLMATPPGQPGSRHRREGVQVSSGNLGKCQQDKAKAFPSHAVARHDIRHHISQVCQEPVGRWSGRGRECQMLPQTCWQDTHKITGQSRLAEKPHFPDGQGSSHGAAMHPPFSTDRSSRNNTCLQDGYCSSGAFHRHR